MPDKLLVRNSRRYFWSLASFSALLLCVLAILPAQAATPRPRGSDKKTTVTLQPVIKARPTPRIVDIRPVIKGEKTAPAETAAPAPEAARPPRRPRPAMPPADFAAPAPETAAPPAARMDKALSDLIALPASAPARDKLKTYVINHPDPAQSVPALMRIAQIDMQLRDWVNAGDTFKSVVQLSKSPAEKAIAREGRIEALLHQGDVEQALEAWAELRAQNPDHVLNPATQVHAGMMLAMQGKGADARKLWDQVERTLQAMPGPQSQALRPQIALARGLADELEGRVDQARATYEELVTRQPQSEAAALARGRIEDISRPLTLTAPPASTAKP
ncbi:MAG: tetratricopeptide repeat protein [Candidatus Sumerlaeia bacterium]